ncbi:MAG: RNA-binding S4 domain-containing protein [Gemmatimonadales bacterium]
MNEPATVRLDVWLWAARFFKTRSLAAEAIDGGKIDLNGERPKRSKPVRPGDQVSIRLGPYHHQVAVTGVAERRGSATVAATLYQETAESKAARQQVADRLKIQNPIFFEGAGRPTKKQRRAIDKWRGRE